ncbi:MAG TPA: tetratricopeptide repeat protein [Novosphingobium sp.]
MSVRHTHWIVLATATFALSGCASFFHSAFFRVPLRPAPQPQLAIRTAPTGYTEAGRAQLAAGNEGLAIEAFQHALGAGEPAAPALNGLAVAYVRINRFDTARNLFEQAIAMAPENPQYAANFTLMLRQQALAMNAQAAERVAVPEQTEQPREVAQAAPAPGQLVQVSASEYQVSTTAPAAAPLIAPKQAGVAMLKLAAVRADAVDPMAAGMPTVACGTVAQANRPRKAVSNPFAGAAKPQAKAGAGETTL